MQSYHKFHTVRNGKDMKVCGTRDSSYSFTPCTGLQENLITMQKRAGGSMLDTVAATL